MYRPEPTGHFTRHTNPGGYAFLVVSDWYQVARALHLGVVQGAPEPDVQDSKPAESGTNLNVQPAVEDLGEARVSLEVAEVLARRVQAMPIVATTMTRTGETFD